MSVNIRKAMVECARDHVRKRTPYQWGGGHHGPSWGLDCSGLILDCARKAGIDPGAWDSSRMRGELPAIESPMPGDLALYLPRHVVMVEEFDPDTGVATIIGANGGWSVTTSPEVAEHQDARVKREPTHLYRDGFVGFRSIRPWGVQDWRPVSPATKAASVLLFATVGAIVYWQFDKEYQWTERTSEWINNTLDRMSG